MTREEAINEIKSWDFLKGKEIEAIQTLIPELAESEDERIRKVIIGIIKNSNIIDINVSEKQMLAYLEKQKEQKPAEWSEEDELKMNALLKYLDPDAGGTKYSSYAQLTEWYNWLKSLRPSWKPSEDEERLINTSISFLKDFADKGYENAVECIDWLKSKLNGNSGK